MEPSRSLTWWGALLQSRPSKLLHPPFNLPFPPGRTPLPGGPCLLLGLSRSVRPHLPRHTRRGEGQGRSPADARAGAAPHLRGHHERQTLRTLRLLVSSACPPLL